MLQQLAQEPSHAMLEINARLAQLYPDCDIALMPAEHMQSGSLNDVGSSKPSQQPDLADNSSADQAFDSTVGSGHWAACGTSPAASSHREHGSTLQTALAASSAPAVSGQHAEEAQHDAAEAAGSQTAFCAAFVGNAPVHGDTYCYHVDADPAGLPPSRSVPTLHVSAALLGLCLHRKTSAFLHPARPNARLVLSLCSP